MHNAQIYNATRLTMQGSQRFDTCDHKTESPPQPRLMLSGLSKSRPTTIKLREHSVNLRSRLFVFTPTLSTKARLISNASTYLVGDDSPRHEPNETVSTVNASKGHSRPDFGSSKRAMHTKQATDSKLPITVRNGRSTNWSKPYEASQNSRSRNLGRMTQEVHSLGAPVVRVPLQSHILVIRDFKGLRSDLADITNLFVCTQIHLGGQLFTSV